MLTRGVKKFVCGEGHGRGMEDAAGEPNEWDDEDELEGVDDVISHLRGGNVEAQDEGYSEAQNAGAAEDGIDSDEEANGEAPG